MSALVGQRPNVYCTIKPIGNFGLDFPSVFTCFFQCLTKDHWLNLRYVFTFLLNSYVSRRLKYFGIHVYSCWHNIRMKSPPNYWMETLRKMFAWDFWNPVDLQALLFFIFFVVHINTSYYNWTIATCRFRIQIDRNCRYFYLNTAFDMQRLFNDEYFFWNLPMVSFSQWV